MNSKLLSYLKFFIGWPLSFISIFFVIKLVIDQSDGVEFNLSQINFIFIGIGVLIFIIYFLFRNYLWWLQLSLLGHRLNFKESTYRFSFSELKRYAPGNIWSFLGRATQFKELGVENKSIATSIINDIQLVIIGCVIASIPSIFFILNNSVELKSSLSTLIPISIILVISFFLATALGYRKKLGAKESLISCLFLPGYNIKSKIKLTIASVITYSTFGIANFLILLSLQSFSITELLILSSFFTFSLLIGYLSFITPMGLGVREGVVTLGLSQIMSVSGAGFFAIFSRIVLIITELSFLFIVFIWARILYKK